MFKLIKIQLKIFASLQTLFPPLKIDIFCRIVPLLSPHARPVTMRASIFLKNFCTPANAVFPFENCHFLSHRPPIISPCLFSNYAQTSPILISPSRNSLCRENRIRGARAARMAGCAEYASKIDQWSILLAYSKTRATPLGDFWWGSPMVGEPPVVSR